MKKDSISRLARFTVVVLIIAAITLFPYALGSGHTIMQCWIDGVSDIIIVSGILFVAFGVWQFILYPIIQWIWNG